MVGDIEKEIRSYLKELSVKYKDSVIEHLDDESTREYFFDEDEISFLMSCPNRFSADPKHVLNWFGFNQAEFKRLYEFCLPVTKNEPDPSLSGEQYKMLQLLAANAYSPVTQLKRVVQAAISGRMTDFDPSDYKYFRGGMLALAQIAINTIIRKYNNVAYQNF